MGMEKNALLPSNALAYDRTQFSIPVQKRTASRILETCFRSSEHISSWRPMDAAEYCKKNNDHTNDFTDQQLIRMEPQSQIEMIQRSQPSMRVIFGNASNFTRVRDVSEFQHYYERPLLVEAWAQTTVEDFDLVDDVQRERNEELKKELGTLREKVRVLEDDLRIHVQLLNQIHATAALKTVRPRNEETVAATQSPPVTLITQQQQNPYQHHQVTRRISPNGMLATTRPVAQTHTYTGSQLINSAQMKIEGPNTVTTTDSIKYTIITGEERDINNGEPIEIQLAEEDGAINLNSSADSGRLEICLSGEEHNDQNHNSETRDVKEEQRTAYSPPLPPLPAQSGILVKRRKVSTNDDNSQHQIHQNRTYYNGYERESANSVICHANSNELPTSTSTSTLQPQLQSELDKTRPVSRLSGERVSSSQSHSMPIQTTPNEVCHHNDENVMVSIGPNNTRVPYKLYEGINWESASIATRKLLMAVFDRNTLATHSMTGRPSPAFRGQSKPEKKRLDPSVTEDIVFVVTRRCKVSDKEVRNAITTKCADENKMMKLQMKKNHNLRDSNKENLTNGAL